MEEYIENERFNAAKQKIIGKKQIVQEELERIANDENLKHLLQQK